MSSPLGVSCSACFSSLRIDNAVCLDVCGHTFHDACIKRWFRPTHLFCPVCRRTCGQYSIIKLFFRPSQDDNGSESTDSDPVYSAHSVENAALSAPVEEHTPSIMELRADIDRLEEGLMRNENFLAEVRSTVRRIEWIIEARPTVPAPPSVGEPQFRRLTLDPTRSRRSRRLEDSSNLPRRPEDSGALPRRPEDSGRPRSDEQLSDRETVLRALSQFFHSDEHEVDPNHQDETTERTTPNDAEVFRGTMGTSFLLPVPASRTAVTPVASDVNSNPSNASRRLRSTPQPRGRLNPRGLYLGDGDGDDNDDDDVIVLN